MNKLERGMLVRVKDFTFLKENGALGYMVTNTAASLSNTEVSVLQVDVDDNTVLVKTKNHGNMWLPINCVVPISGRMTFFPGQRVRVRPNFTSIIPEQNPNFCGDMMKYEGTEAVIDRRAPGPWDDCYVLSTSMYYWAPEWLELIEELEEQPMSLNIYHPDIHQSRTKSSTTKIDKQDGKDQQNGKTVIVPRKEATVSTGNRPGGNTIRGRASRVTVVSGYLTNKEISV